MKPGTYRTTGNTDDMCYWERAKDAKGEMDSLLANDNVSGTSYVTIKATDKLFKSSGCADWEAVDPKAKGKPASSMDGDGGMFRVGTDIAPGNLPVHRQCRRLLLLGAHEGRRARAELDHREQQRDRQRRRDHQRDGRLLQVGRLRRLEEGLSAQATVGTR